MYTSCPICQTVFRVTEAQLERAGGRVRCGQCQHVFNARDDLHSEPPRADAGATSEDETTATSVPSSSVSPAESQADVPPADSATGEAAEPTIETDDAIAELEQLDVDLSIPSSRASEDNEERGEDSDFEWPEEDVEKITIGSVPPSPDEGYEDLPQPAPVEDELESSTASAMGVEHDQAERPEPLAGAEPEAEPTISRAWTQAAGEFNTTPQDSEDQATESGEPTAADDERPAEETGAAETDRLAANSDEIPTVLREALAEAQQPPRSGWMTATAVAVSTLLVVTLLAQLGFYNRSSLIQRYPALTPFAQKLCARLGCEIELPRDVSRVVVVSRDVRSHPTVSGALLITATINNDATFAQPCPDVELSLFDLTGTLVAQRRFAPEEYLDDAPRPGTVAMMQPDKPIRLRLEVRDPGQHAINYEFTFL